MPKRVMQGRVVSNKPDKTVVVVVEKHYQHPMYGKFIRKTLKFHAHDPENRGKEGDVVMIRECRPLSKMKRWELYESEKEREEG